MVELREVKESRGQSKEKFGCHKALRMSLMAINTVFNANFLANLPFGKPVQTVLVGCLFVFLVTLFVDFCCRKIQLAEMLNFIL